jgi:Predicted esterase of the alpha-beta hydrolase superfamily
MASGSLPPGFAATEVDGEFYWDGGLVSNTPLQWVLDSRPRKDTLAFQIDLWSARGALPHDLTEVEVRTRTSCIQVGLGQQPINTRRHRSFVSPSPIS